MLPTRVPGRQGGMRIAWVVSAQGLEATPGGLYSRTASYRYRMIIPAKELKKRGHEIFAVGASGAAGGYEYAVQELQDAEVAVFGKMPEVELQGRLIEAARKAGIRTVVDVCDDYFTADPQGQFYGSVVASGDAISTSSEFLAARIAEAIGRRATIIVDPCEGARNPPQWQPKARLEAVWFGQEKNLVGLDKSLRGIAASGIPMRLVVVTGGGAEVLEWYRRSKPAVAASIDLELREWSLDATARALQACDVVLIPIDRDQGFYLSKGPNRLVEALWAGRFVVAHRLPAYEKFSEWAWVGDDISEGLRWAMDHPGEIAGRIARAQERIAVEFSAKTVAEDWERLLAEVCGRPGS